MIIDRADAIITMLNINRSKPVLKIKLDKLASFIFLEESIKIAPMNCKKSDKRE